MASDDEPLSVLEATRASIEAVNLDPTDAGAAAVLLRLAEAIDAIDEDGLNPGGKLDNVSVPTYLKYATALGLTPEARKAPPSRQGEEGGARGKLHLLRAGVHQATGGATG